MKRTYTCGELTKNNIDEKVTLNGWVSTYRNHGGILFVDLRDRYGLTQLVFDPQKMDETIYTLGESLRSEYVVCVEGCVCARLEGRENSQLTTGAIEVLVENLFIYNVSDTPPISLLHDDDVNEDIRLKYRYLDLRRSAMQKNFIQRNDILFVLRSYLRDLHFLELETPLLCRSTPEGARDYLVPSRLSSGKFFALPQSPQLYKQLLMIAGMDKYYQVTKCFRDEDLRADRQPEFTQIDIEMSFIDEEDIFTLIEGFLQKIFNELWKKDLEIPFPRMKYKEAMSRYGSDCPDTRYGMELIDVSDICKGVAFKVFSAILSSGGKVKCLVVSDYVEVSSGEINKLNAYAQEFGAKGLAWFKCFGEEIRSPILKFFDEETIKQIRNRTQMKKGDVIFFVADKEDVVHSVLGRLRSHLAQKLDLIPADQFSFLWVTHFPLMQWSEEEKRYVSIHHPFTAPLIESDESVELLAPEKLLSRSYDIILNGVELGGGSLRIYQKDLQKKIFALLGLTEEESQEKFGFLLDALSFGAPPHGGIALGLDRLLMLLLQKETIRDVIPFPKTQKAGCLLTEAPSVVSEKQLAELHIGILDDE